MSEHCNHTDSSAWTGPTSKDVLAAARRSALRICFTNVASGEELTITVDAACESLIGPTTTFSGRCRDGRRIEQGVICSDNYHPGTSYIQFEVRPLLALVADAG